MADRPFRTITTECRVFRLPEGIGPVHAKPGVHRIFVPATVSVTYERDVLPGVDAPQALLGDPVWRLHQMSLTGGSAGAVYWTLEELRQACARAAEIVGGDAVAFLTEKNGSAPKWLTSRTTTASPSPGPPLPER